MCPPDAPESVRLGPGPDAGPRVLAGPGAGSPWSWVYKPPGLPVFPPNRGTGPSLLRWLVAEGVAEEGFPPGFGAGIAHRLDTSTSGVVLVASDAAALAGLREAFALGRFVKVYRFLSFRDVSWDRSALEAPLAHHPRRKDRMVVQRGQDTPHRGRWYPASTRLERLAPPVWQATITTGVMHQVRLHAAYAGLALAGDRLYGGGAWLGAPDGVGFGLHHVGLSGTLADGRHVRSPEVLPPHWWASVRPAARAPGDGQIRAAR